MRQIIEIDEEKCNGCGQCILSCAEGALALVDGKARLVGEVYCDGLGACIGECPEGALKIIEREAEDFDEKAVEDLLAKQKQSAPQEATLACGCPGSMAMSLEKSPSTGPGSGPEIASTLSHWPIKLQLLGPGAPFLQGADLLLLADCTAAAFPNLHQKLLPGRVVALGCPKLDDLEAHITRLAEILKVAHPRSLTVVHMEVPCCRGFVFAAEEALKRSGVSLPLSRIMISRNGDILEEVALKTS
jgi:Pyruvate/2-oxoacid:ferredoxin oxidoreductase delta subunit